jgi:hypothetical protein
MSVKHGHNRVRDYNLHHDTADIPVNEKKNKIIKYHVSKTNVCI